jgi:hypothetical protein
VTGHQPDECDDRVRLARATCPGEQRARRALAEAPRPFAARLKRSRARSSRCRSHRPGSSGGGSQDRAAGRHDSTSPYRRRFAAPHLRRNAKVASRWRGRRRRAQPPGRTASDMEGSANRASIRVRPRLHPDAVLDRFVDAGATLRRTTLPRPLRARPLTPAGKPVAQTGSLAKSGSGANVGQRPARTRK